MHRVAQPVTCLSAETCLAADPEAVSSTPARFHTFMEIDHFLLPSADSRRVVVSNKRKYVHEVPVNDLAKPVQ